MSTYRFTNKYPNNEPVSVNDLLRQLLIPRKWRHFLRIEKKILINGNYRNFNELVFPNDEYSIMLTHVANQQHSITPSGHLPTIIYEDKNILVINKPSNQKTHPNLFETDTAMNDVTTYLGYTPYIIHRLDMLTNGLLLFAKNPAVVPILNRQLTTKIMKRNYYATVKLKNIPNQGTIDLPIAQDPNDQRKRIVDDNGLKAITHYQVIARNSIQNTMTLKLTLETGRTHQIRVHLASINLPIIGDPLYNPDFNGEALALTAYELSLISPFTFDTLKVTLPNKKDYPNG